MINDTSTALFNYFDFGPCFGTNAGSYYSDIRIYNNSNKSTGSKADFGSSYNLPPGYSYGQANTRSYLAGNYENWLTTEIEVFQIFFN